MRGGHFFEQVFLDDFSNCWWLDDCWLNHFVFFLEFENPEQTLIGALFVQYYSAPNDFESSLPMSCLRRHLLTEWLNPWVAEIFESMNYRKYKYM